MRSTSPPVWLRVTTIVAVAATIACVAGPRIRELNALGQNGQTDSLVEMLGDSRSWVREEAARVLGVRRMAAARGVLLERAQSMDERRYVRAAAVRALGRIGNSQDRGALEALARVPGTAPELKLALVEALCRLQPDPATFEVLAMLSDDEDLLVSACASTEVEQKCAR